MSYEAHLATLEARARLLCEDLKEGVESFTRFTEEVAEVEGGELPPDFWQEVQNSPQLELNNWEMKLKFLQASLRTKLELDQFSDDESEKVQTALERLTDTISSINQESGSLEDQQAEGLLEQVESTMNFVLGQVETEAGVNLPELDWIKTGEDIRERLIEIEQIKAENTDSSENLTLRRIEEDQLDEFERRLNQDLSQVVEDIMLRIVSADQEAEFIDRKENLIQKIKSKLSFSFTPKQDLVITTDHENTPDEQLEDQEIQRELQQEDELDYEQILDLIDDYLSEFDDFLGQIEQRRNISESQVMSILTSGGSVQLKLEGEPLVSVVSSSIKDFQIRGYDPEEDEFIQTGFTDKIIIKLGNKGQQIVNINPEAKEYYNENPDEPLLGYILKDKAKILSD